MDWSSTLVASVWRSLCARNDTVSKSDSGAAPPSFPGVVKFVAGHVDMRWLTGPATEFRRNSCTHSDMLVVQALR